MVYPKGHQWEGVLNECDIIFILEGSLHLTYDRFTDRHIPTKKIFLLPPGCHFNAYTEEGVTCLVYRIQDSFRFCDHFSIENLQKEKIEYDVDEDLLDINEEMELYLSFFMENLDNGLRCVHYLELKTKELFFLFRTYYSKELLAAFCHPLISMDASFSEFVFKNYKSVKTVNEFAALASYSTSGFEKKFKQVFGLSAYQWMKQKKNQQLYHELNATDKPIKLIAEEQGFPSLPQFNDYCKKHFGFPPGKIRKMNRAT
ncbi:AraC family transcriptional regulator [Parabacteroides sp. PM5-20]|uniref:helix-turn-helix domain-containing protein n=1 Tax=unclassified Parabacteroides TaxID=2649774 RepID=UPI0013D7780A|nr:AraC family transcriptional regulator [Parabacteroides sp. PM5-20]